jgi:hypothetical protein
MRLMSRRAFLAIAAALGAGAAMARATPVRSAAEDPTFGGPLRYRVVHQARRWEAGQRPQLNAKVLEGHAGLSI